MNLAQSHVRPVTEALAHVRQAAERAERADDLDAAKAALNSTWTCIRIALETINDAERATRAAALAKVERAA